MPLWAARKDTDPAAPLARAYLDVNCAHCHQPGGGASNSGLDLRWEQPDAHAIGIMKRPVAAGRGAGGHDFSILPGEPDKSILLFRMDSAEPGIAMPELGKSSVDREGVAVVRKWILEMQQQ
jgi:mono/diheme cytochrome c family protein